MSDIERKKCLPENDRYLAVKLLKLMPILFGKKGKFIYELAIYFRWVDNIVDEDKNLNQEQKIDFLKNQITLVEQANAEQLPGINNNNIQIPEKLKLLGPEIRQEVCNQLEAMLYDAHHSDLEVRSDEDIREYNIRTLTTTMALGLLIMNNRPIKGTEKFWEWAQWAMTLAGLECLGEDLSMRQLKLSMPEHSAGSKVTIEQVLDYFNENRFNELKVKSMKGMIKNITGFLEIGIPLWQAIMAMGYTLEAVAKRTITMNRDKSVRIGQY